LLLLLLAEIDFTRAGASFFISAFTLMTGLLAMVAGQNGSLLSGAQIVLHNRIIDSDGF